MTKLISKFIFNTILGWKLIGTIAPEVKKCVIIGAPHTSWHDFYISVLFRSIIDLPMHFIGKKSLFDSFWGSFFKMMGGIPVDRSRNSNLVDAVANIFKERNEFRLAISPEGTRKKVNSWKTGFYYIAKQADVPIIMITFDFGRKQIKVSEPYTVTDNKEQDFKYFHDFYKDVVGKYPERS